MSARWIDFRRIPALRDTGDGEVVAAEDAVAAGPDFCQRGAAFGIDLDAAGLHCDRSAAAVERSGIEALADRLEHLVGVELQGLAGANEFATVEHRVFELDADDLAIFGDDLFRLQPVADGDALRRGEILLELGSIHVLLAAPVADRHFLRAKQLRLHGGVDGRHAAANDDDAAADRQLRQILSLPKDGDELDGILDAVALLTLGAQGIDAGKAEAKKHRIVARSQLRQMEIAAERLAVLDCDAADRGDVVDFGLGKIVDALVGGDAVFVEPAGFRPGLQDGDVMAVAGEPVRRGKTGRTGANYRDLLAGGCRPLVELLVLCHRHVGSVALQAADLHRLALGDLTHADLLAQGLGRADAGAHATKNVLVEDGFRRTQRIAGGNLPDEQRDVDRSRAGLHAGRVVAEIAAVGLDQRLVMIERGVQVGKIVGILRRRQPCGGDAFLEQTFGHSRSFPILVLTKASTVYFFINRSNFELRLCSGKII